MTQHNRETLLADSSGAHPTDRAGGLRPEPVAPSQPEALIPCADALIERTARAICEAGNNNPDELTFWRNGENWEPYGDRWTRYIDEAHAAIAVSRNHVQRLRDELEVIRDWIMLDLPSDAPDAVLRLSFINAVLSGEVA